MSRERRDSKSDSAARATMLSAIQQLTFERFRSPTVKEVAGRLRISEEAVVEALATGAEAWPVPLSGNAIRREEGLRPAGASGVAKGAEDAEIEALLESLPEREGLVLRLRYLHRQTQQQIALRLGIHQVLVSRLIRNALGMLRRLDA